MTVPKLAINEVLCLVRIPFPFEPGSVFPMVPSLQGPLEQSTHGFGAQGPHAVDGTKAALMFHCLIPGSGALGIAEATCC